MKVRFAWMALGSLLSLSVVSCGEEDENRADPSLVAAGGSVGASGGSGAGGQQSGELQPFVAPSDPGKGGILVTVSGEDLAIQGYPFLAGSSKAGGDPPAFVDGWEVQLEHFILTVGGIRLNDGPDKNADNPKEMGEVVAQVEGLFAVDISLGGGLVGKSGSPDEKTVAITAFTGPSSGGEFKTDQRYAFSYDFAVASSQAKNVNLDAAGVVLYQQAILEGWSVVIQGKAIYKSKPPTEGTVFAKIPQKIRFTLGFANPASYINCQNTDLNPLGDGVFPRGVQVSPSASTVAQITMHSDHLFWDRLNAESGLLHFDPIAALASTYGVESDHPGEVTMEDLDGADFIAFKTRSGEPLPARSEVADYTAPDVQLSFDGNGITFPKNSFSKYLAYSLTSGGHFNANGECEVVLNFEH